MRSGWKLLSAGTVLIAVCLTGEFAVAQEGLLLSGVGPINRAMGGASTAAPVDASGALHWNPASIMGLQQSELEFGVELLYPQPTLGSSVGAGALGGGIPPVSLSGSTDSNSGVFAIPTVGFVYRPKEEPWALGLGVFGIGGFGTNYQGGTVTNPILSPGAPNGIGLGPMYSKLQIVQIAPTFAYQLTDRLSFGIAPTITAADLSLDPNFLSSPNDANANGFFSYPSGTHGRTTWGYGVQAGLYLTTENCWNFGASIKSPQWMQTFHWSGANELGQPVDVRTHFDLPLVASLGASYTGFDRWLLAIDGRYFDYGSTQGFDTTGFDATGAVAGLGWRSIFSVAAGAQYQATDSLALRLGYVWNQNPIPDSNTFFNVISPNILMHTISCGFSYQLTPSWLVSFAYLHAFENSASGPWYAPGIGALPGTSVTNRVSADALTAGLTVKF
ncbi:MAG: outer membrane protein transport protein [Planctomycetaceae bacterium]